MSFDSEDIDKYYTNKLTEEVYCAKDFNDDDRIQTELDKFFKALVSRRRYDREEGGIQACIVLFPDKFAAKIAEGDGLDSHFVTSINLVEFLNNRNKYLSSSGAGYYGLSKDERKELYEALQFRIIDNPEELMIAITSSLDIDSSFQLDVLKRVILLCKELMDKKVYRNISMGLNTPSIHIDFEDWSVGRENLFVDNIEKSKIRL